jgi:capsule polysaccharide export protein KpsE/RkpR
MQRLLAGRPERTDGRLIKDNLWKEAQVSRATMNRAPDVLAEWNTRLAATDARTPGEARRDEQLAKLRRRLTTVTAERDRLREQVNAAATAIGALHADNIALRQELDRHGAVVALDQYR